MRTNRTKLYALIALAFCGLAAAQTSRVSVHIESQPMRLALKDLGEQTGLQIMFRAEDVAKDAMTAPRISGQLSAKEALDKMLANTALQYRFVNPNTVLISAKGAVEKEKTALMSQIGTMRLVRAEALSASQGEGKGESQKEASDSSETEGKGSAGEISEIVVTARKTNERLQDVPVTVTAFSGQQLKERGAVDVKDILGSVPGLSFSDVERGQSKYTIRGINSSVPTPTTGVYLDDISLITGAADYASGAFDPILFDIERVEVLKGPQGTLYGGSAMGGAIKYISARPDLTGYSGEVAVGAGSIAHGSENYSAEGIVNFPLIADRLALRIGAKILHDGGFIDNVAGLNAANPDVSSAASPTYVPLLQPSLSTQSAKDYNTGDAYVGRVSLLWQPDDSWSIRPTVTFQKSTLDNPPQFFLTAPSPLESSYRYINQSSPDKATISSLEVTKSFGAVELTSLTAYFDRQAVWFRDYSFYIGALLPFTYSLDSTHDGRMKFTNFSQELRFASKNSGDRLRWTGGLYYSAFEYDNDSLVLVNGMSSILGTDVLVNGLIKNKQDQSAAFGELSYRLTDALEVTAGARVFKVKLLNTGASTGLLASAATRLDSSEHGVNPKVGLSYKISADHMVFASAAKGFRPGGPLGNFFPGCRELVQAFLGAAQPPTSFESDSLWAYELGSKNEFLGGRAVVNASLFYSDWKDIQQIVGLSGTAPGSTTSCAGTETTLNVGAARVRGIEVESRFNLTSALQLGLNGSYMDAEIKDGGIPQLVGADAFPQAGDRILETPKWSGTAYLSYAQPLSQAWDLFLRADYQYRGDQRRTFNDGHRVSFASGPPAIVPYSQDTIYQGSYDVLAASVAIGNDTTNFRLYVDNALDARPLIDINFVTKLSRGTTLRPRTIGIEMRQRF